MIGPLDLLDDDDQAETLIEGEIYRDRHTHPVKCLACGKSQVPFDQVVREGGTRGKMRIREWICSNADCGQICFYGTEHRACPHGCGRQVEGPRKGNRWVPRSRCECQWTLEEALAYGMRQAQLADEAAKLAADDKALELKREESQRQRRAAYACFVECDGKCESTKANPTYPGVCNHCPKLKVGKRPARAWQPPAGVQFEDSPFEEAN